MTTKEVLIKAKEAIQKDGWVQHRYRSEEGYCMVGALLEVTELNNVRVELYGPAYNALSHALPNGKTCVSEWNDILGRTKEEVLALFDRAIAAQEDVK